MKQLFTSVNKSSIHEKQLKRQCLAKRNIEKQTPYFKQIWKEKKKHSYTKLKT